MQELKNFRGISFLRVVRKISVEILVDKVRKVTDELIDEQRGFRSGMACVDQIFILRQKGEKAWENKQWVNEGFIDLKKANDRVNREAL